MPVACLEAEKHKIMPDPRDSFSKLPLPAGVSEDYVDCSETNGLVFHILKSGYDASHSKPLVLLLHGFPELAYSWRHIMPALTDAGYCAVAVDHRGYGRTLGWDSRDFHNVDLKQFALTNIVRDMVALVYALGYASVRCVVGHDFGAVVSAMCALMRPDLFESCIIMSHPFKGSPSLPFDILHLPKKDTPTDDIQSALASLNPPRKHYKWYNSTPPAAGHWDNPAQGMRAYLRGYFHLKSADWKGNAPYPLTSWTATELAKMPHYYIMPLDQSMPEAIASDMKTEDADATKHWLSDEELDIYVQEWSRTGFQGGLNFYRITTDPKFTQDVQLFAGKKIEVPCTFISGEKDWGNYQEPGAVENMPNVCRDFRGVRYIKDASHWVQQEQPKLVAAEILGFLAELKQK